MAAVGAGLALLAATVWAARSPRPRQTALVAGACIAWLLLNSPLEGPVLFTVAEGHGLTVADLLVPCAVLVTLLARRRGAAWKR